MQAYEGENAKYTEYIAPRDGFHFSATGIEYQWKEIAVMFRTEGTSLHHVDSHRAASEIQ